MITEPNTLGLFESQHPRDHRDVPRQGRAGVHGRREPQRHPRHHAPRRPRLRRLPLQPAQDLHHAARRRRAGRGPGGHQGAPGAVPAGAGGRQATDDGATRSTGNRPQSIGKLQAFWGNFGMLVRAYTYIRTMGPDGLRAVSENAVLNANYILKRLEGDYDRAGAGPVHARVRALRAPAEEARRDRDGHRQAAARPRASTRRRSTSR